MKISNIPPLPEIGPNVHSCNWPCSAGGKLGELSQLLRNLGKIFCRNFQLGEVGESKVGRVNLDKVFMIHFQEIGRTLIFREHLFDQLLRGTLVEVYF